MRPWRVAPTLSLVPMIPTDTPSRALFRDGLPRARHLVTPGWLAPLAAGRPVVEAPAANWRLFEVDEGPPTGFLQGHIPDAGYIDTNWLARAPLWNAIPVATMQALLLRLGIGPHSTVVLYGRTASAAGGAAHPMLVAGVADVRLLDGGLNGWLRIGGALACGRPRVHPRADDAGVSFVACPHYLVHTAEVRQGLGRRGTRLLSIRTWDEYIGKTSGYSYIEARGEIPGTVWGHAGEDNDMNSVSAFQNAGGTMRPARELQALWKAAGIVRQLRTVFYCGTGWRASTAFFYAWLMGWDAIGVDDGGWLEWSSDPANQRAVHGAAAESRVISLPV